MSTDNKSNNGYDMPTQTGVHFKVTLKKVKAEHLYSASSWEPHPRSAQVWITQLLPCKYTIPRKHSPDGATTSSGSNHLITAYYSLIYRPRKDERLSWPSWLNYSGRFRPTHINGYPSAAGDVQVRESPPVKDRRSSTELHQPTAIFSRFQVHNLV